MNETVNVRPLSPGALVRRRFMRGWVGVTGAVILIALLLFSFVCPLLYPYGQTEIFRKYEMHTASYATAVQRTEFVSLRCGPDSAVHYAVGNMMGSNISAMREAGLEEMQVTDPDGAAYTIRRLGELVYTLEVEKTSPAAACTGLRAVASYNTRLRAVTYAGEKMDAAFEADVQSAAQTGAELFTSGGETYLLRSAGVKDTLSVIAAGSGSFAYEGDALPSGFEAAFIRHIADGGFSFGGDSYIIRPEGDGFAILKRLGSDVAMVATPCVFDAFEAGTTFSDGFRAKALLALYDGGSFSDGGTDYVITGKEGGAVITTAAAPDAPVALLSTFVVRRQTGEDTLSLEFKLAARAAVTRMETAGLTEDSFAFALPGADEAGASAPADTDIHVSRQGGHYVLSCEMPSYIIDIYAPPGAQHPLGTDADGMDVLARMMYGGRVSLTVGLIVVLLETVLGAILGGVAGYFGGLTDSVIMRLADVFYCIPSLPILIILGAFFDELRLDAYMRLVWMMAVMGVLGWAGVARLVRGQILSLREREYMMAVEATGLRIGRRIFRHLLPGVLPQLTVSATMGLGSVIIYESTLSFLGLGVKHPLATWGSMINSVTASNENFLRYMYIWLPVGLLICLTVIAFNFVGDGLRDAFDPRMKR